MQKETEEIRIDHHKNLPSENSDRASTRMDKHTFQLQSHRDLKTIGQETNSNDNLKINLNGVLGQEQLQKQYISPFNVKTPSKTTARKKKESRETTPFINIVMTRYSPSPHKGTEFTFDKRKERNQISINKSNDSKQQFSIQFAKDQIAYTTEFNAQGMHLQGDEKQQQQNMLKDFLVSPKQ